VARTIFDKQIARHPREIGTVLSSKLVFGLKRLVFGTKFEVMRVGTIPKASAYVFIRRAGNSTLEGWPLDAVDNERQKNAFKNFRKSLAEIHISQFIHLTHEDELRQLIIPTPNTVKHKLLDTKVENFGIYLFPNKRVKLPKAAKPVKSAETDKSTEADH
jgi:hypothetical protein